MVVAILRIFLNPPQAADANSQTSSTKLPTNHKLQIPNTLVSNLSFVCYLELVLWDFPIPASRLRVALVVKYPSCVDAIHYGFR